MDKIAPFKLERYFARYEFTARYLLSPSDCQSISMHDLLEMADPEMQKMWQSLSLGYTESLGHPLLRAEIAGLYEKINPEQVLEVVPEEGIHIAIHTLLQPGDHAVVIAPAYQSLYEIARSFPCQVSPWWIQLVDGKWKIDLETLEKLITPQTRLLVVNFPHNPTGFLPTRQEFDHLVEIARKHDLYLLSDEMYRFLEHDPAMRLSSVCDLYEKGITLGGLSKTFAMPGLRMGWLVTRDASLYQRWMVYKDYTTICGSAPSELLAIIALRNREQIAERSLNIVLKNLATARGFFTGYPNIFGWIPPTGGSIAFPKFLPDMPVETFCNDVVQKKNVMITPGSLFDFPGSHFRIGLGRTNFSEALSLVEEYVLNDLSR